MDLRPVIHIVGILVCMLAISMIIPMAVDLAVGNPDWKDFFLSSILTAFFGGMAVIGTSNIALNIVPRQGFLMITISWIALSLFSALPLWLCSYDLSFVDAVFESVSGLTTTGSTVITHLDKAPPGILIWRAMLQWLGGIGVVLMAMSVMPFLKVGGMQLFQTELSESEKALPRLTKLASSIGGIYVCLTLACAILYMMTGMTEFDAFAHAMSTISTGGFSTFDTSFAHYHKVWTEVVCIIFMILGGLPFVLYLKAVNGNFRPLYKDSQVRWFLSIVGASIAALTLYLVFHLGLDISEALRRASFNVVSIVTGTGFINGDYGQWGGFAVSLLFFLMVVGACAGSTTCGIKIFRFQILYSITRTQLRQLLHPHGVFIPHYNGKSMPPGVAGSVMSFFCLYAFCFCGLAIALSFTGLDFLTAMSAAATAISNVGPGLGEIIGPSGTFQPLPDSAKWILSIGMLLGRLEIFTVLILLTPQFWRR